MNMPGFTAEASIYKSSRSYNESVHAYGSDRSQIVSPARIFGGWNPFPRDPVVQCAPFGLQVAADRLCEVSRLGPGSGHRGSVWLDVQCALSRDGFRTRCRMQHHKWSL